MVNLIVGFPSGDVHVYLWMLGCRNIILLTLRFLDVAKFTNVTPLSLLISCKLSFPIVGLKMSSLPTLALKSPNRIFIWYLGNYPSISSYVSKLDYSSLGFQLKLYSFLGASSFSTGYYDSFDYLTKSMEVSPS
jgi:hypothetical protein